MRPLGATPPAMNAILLPARACTACRQKRSSAALWQRSAGAAPKGCAWQRDRYRWCLQAAGKEEARSAAAEKGPSSSSVGTEVKPKVPDAAIGPSTSSRTEAAPAAPIENVEDAEGVLAAARRGAVQNLLTEQEIRQLATQRREQGRAQSMGFLEGLQEEVQLIEWPSPLQPQKAWSVKNFAILVFVSAMTSWGLVLALALRDTVVVISLVGGLAVFLFAVNSLLSEASRAVSTVQLDPYKPIGLQIFDALQQQFQQSK